MLFWVIVAVVVTLAIASPGRAQVAGSNVLHVAAPEIKDAATVGYLDAFRKRLEGSGIGVREIAVPADLSLDEVLQFLRSGSGLDLALIPITAIPEVRSIPTFTYTSLISQPGLIENATQNFAVQDSVIGDLAAAEISDIGLTVVGFWNRPPQALFLKRPLLSAQDLKGVKVRISDEASGAVLSELGADPLGLAYAEVAVALDTGVVDAVETAVDGPIVPQLYKSIRDGQILNNYNQNQGFMLVNSANWLGYSELVRSTIRNAALDGEKISQSIILEQEGIVRKTAEEFGVGYASLSPDGWEAIQTISSNNWLAKSPDETRKEAYSQLTRVKEEVSARRGRGGSLTIPRTQPPVLFATNRNDEGTSDLETRFGVEKDNSNELNCGRIIYLPQPSREFGATFEGAISLSNEKIWNKGSECAELVNNSVGDDKGLVIFFHGYYNSFSDAIRRAIGFSEDFGLSQPVLVWSWPSAGTRGAYVFDLNSVQFSEEHVRQFVDALELKGQLSNITVVAHSMGSRMAGVFLKQVRAKGQSIKNLIFIAADYPPSLFGQLVRSDGAVAPMKTLYANEHDRALWLSKKVNGEIPIGLGGKYLHLVPGVETVDVSAVAHERWPEKNHAHGFDVPLVAQDVSALMKQRIGADGRQLPAADIQGIRYWMIREKPSQP
ncbi:MULTISPECIES: TRAP transporter substrate-binding protein DctP [unclassified Ensifer]|uniref:TRAP transporter substrate-binding protein DctP n=1 Tax=unclassified Ensifer TaxID=2633371 RepID=UPI001FCDCEF7|nr:MULTISPECIES: TRAP transporter substrate-binding protein DctP [unclassified Ensifer]